MIKNGSLKAAIVQQIPYAKKNVNVILRQDLLDKSNSVLTRQMCSLLETNEITVAGFWFSLYSKVVLVTIHHTVIFSKEQKIQFIWLYILT